MIAPTFPRIHDLLQDLVRITQRFVVSNEPLLEFLEHDEHFSVELMAWFHDYNVKEGRFALLDFIPGGCVHGTEVHFIHVKEAEDALGEAIDALRRQKDPPELLPDEAFEQRLIDYLFESLCAPFVAKDITQMRRDLLSVFLPSFKEKYPALSKQVSYTLEEINVIINQIINDLIAEAEISDLKISNVTRFIKELHRCASKRLSRLADAQQGNLFRE